MKNYFVYENTSTKERVIIKTITDRMLMIYRLKNNVVNGEFIDYNDLGSIKSEENLKLIYRYKAFGEIPSEVDFRMDIGIDISSKYLEMY